MKILVLGYSNIFQNKINEIFENSDYIESIYIASFSKSQNIPIKDKTKKLYSDYFFAIENSDADIAYITTKNSLHLSLIKSCLIKGLHVIVDKPAFLINQFDYEILELAKEKELLFSEAIVYYYHSQIDVIKKQFATNNDTPTNIFVSFSMPGFKEDNFRYSNIDGGGSFHDLSSYALTIGDVFFNTSVKEIFVNKSHDKIKNVDTSFSVIINYNKPEKGDYRKKRTQLLYPTHNGPSVARESISEYNTRYSGK